MMTGPIHILHFEDSPADERLFQEYLKESPGDYRVEVAGRLSEGLELLARNSVDVVLLDLGLPDSRGIQSVKKVLSQAPGVPIIVLSGQKDEGLAMRAVHEGAQDYLIKGDVNARVLARSIDYAIERKRAEQRVIHLNRLLMSVREIGRLIVKEKEKEALLTSACDTLHTVAGYDMVWIGLIERGHDKVVPVAASGVSKALLERETVTWDDSPTGMGPSGTAVRIKGVCVFRDADDKTFDPWRKAVERTGVKSCIAAPLIRDDTIFGVLNVYSKHRDMFSKDEVALIEEVGRDLAFALATIESERERARVEEALRESERRYQTLFDSAGDAIFVHDFDGRFLDVNRAACERLGYSRDELLGMTLADIDTPESAALIPERTEDLIKKGWASFEAAHVAKDGRTIPVELSVRIIDYGDREALLSVARDITERKRTEEAIESQNAFMQDLINAIPNPVLYKDAQGRYLGCNAAFERYLGRTRDEIVGRMASDFLPRELGGVYHEKDEELLANPGTQVYEARIPNAEGIPRDLVFNKATFLDKAGAVGGLVGVIMDITERKRAEEAIRESEEKFRSLFESSRDVVYLSTLEGKFLDVNPAAEGLFEYSREELLEIDSRKLYSDPDERERFKRTVTENGFVKDYEAAMLKKGGAIVDCLITASVRKDAEGNIVGYQGIIRDITERKRMEQRLVQAEKLSSLGGILSGVAHELNNPLTSIIGNAQLLMRKEIGQEIRCKLEVIMKESVRSAKIIQGLLAFARKHKPERIPIDINDVITESYRLREYELKVNNVNARLDLSPDIPETLADPYQLQQVFMNIINNANDALTAAGGGSLIIRSRLSGDSIVMEFVDDGPGIPEDIKKYIFDPFFTTKEVGKGTGLGLSIAYGIVSEHGGKIDVESSPGKGTTFSIELPLTADNVGRKETVQEPTHSPNGKKTLLVVEDETSLRNLIKEALTGEGYHVDTSGSGEEAIESIEKNEYGAIISDLKMPGLGGKELYTFVQKYYPGLSNKMVFITGDVLGRDTQNFLRITGNRYLEKPFEIKKLLNVLADVVSA